MNVTIENLSFKKLEMSFSGESYEGIFQPSSSIKCDIKYPIARVKNTIASVTMIYRFTAKGIGYDMLFDFKTEGVFLIKKGEPSPITEQDVYECYKMLVALSQEYVNNNRSHIKGNPIGLFALPYEAAYPEISLCLQKSLHVQQ